jgi:hypothetical protein
MLDQYNLSLSNELHKNELLLIEQDKKTLEQELEKAKKNELVVKAYCSDILKLEAKEYIYIAGTDTYSRNHLFKIGKATEISSRMMSYNTGRAKCDKMKLFYYRKCFDSGSVEKMIKGLIYKFVEQKNKEMYVIEFDDLVGIVSSVIDGSDDAIKIINRLSNDHPNIKNKEGRIIDEIIIDDKKEPSEEIVIDELTQYFKINYPDTKIIFKVPMDHMLIVYWHELKNYPKIKGLEIKQSRTILKTLAARFGFTTRWYKKRN